MEAVAWVGRDGQGETGSEQVDVEEGWGGGGVAWRQ